MRAALKDKCNQRFQLMCETSIPLRSSIYVYEQMLALNASRIASLIQVMYVVLAPIT